MMGRLGWHLFYAGIMLESSGTLRLAGNWQRRLRRCISSMLTLVIRHLRTEEVWKTGRPWYGLEKAVSETNDSG
jgi:hypothetical protein